ncbi:MAG: hypothetical protein WBJ81_05870, partial [Rickettsiales bacterium]
TAAVSIKTKDGVAHTTTDVKTHLESLNDRTGDTAAVSIKTKDGVAHTLVDVKTHLESLNDRLGATSDVTTKNLSGVSSTFADVKTHLSNLEAKVGNIQDLKAGSHTINDNTGQASIAASTMVDILSNVDRKIGNTVELTGTSANKVVDKTGAATVSGSSLKTIVSNIDGKVGQTHQLTGSSGTKKVLDNTGTAVASGSDLPTVIYAIEVKTGDVSQLRTSSNSNLVESVNEVISYVNTLAGVERDDTIEGALSDINTNVGNKPLITSTSSVNSLTGGINKLQLEHGKVSLDTHFNKDDVNSFANIKAHLTTLLNVSDNYATSLALATTIVNAITSQEGVTPGLTIDELKTDIDATVSGETTLSTIKAAILTNLSALAADSSNATTIKNSIYAAGAITDSSLSGTNGASLQTDLTNSRTAGFIVTTRSALGDDDISGIEDIDGNTLATNLDTSLTKAFLTLNGKIGNNSNITATDSNGESLVGQNLVFALNAVNDKIKPAEPPMLFPYYFYNPYNYLGYDNWNNGDSQTTISGSIGTLSTLNAGGGAASVVAYIGTAALPSNINVQGGTTASSTVLAAVNNLHTVVGGTDISKIGTSLSEALGTPTGAGLLGTVSTKVSAAIGGTALPSIGVAGTTTAATSLSDGVNKLNTAVGTTDISALVDKNGSPVDNNLSAVLFAVDGKFGDLTSLETTVKTSMVNAVNSIVNSNGLVDNANIADSAVSGNKIAALGVTTGKYAAGSIATADIGNAQVTAGKMAVASVTGATIADGGVGAGKYAAGSIATADIATGAVTGDTIAALGVTTGKYAAGSIATADIANLAVTAAKMATNSVTGDTIAALGVTTGKYAAGSIATADIATGAVTADKIAAATITTGKVAFGTLTGDHAGVGTGNLALATIAAGNIATGAVTNAKQGFATWKVTALPAGTTSKTWTSNAIDFNAEITDCASIGVALDASIYYTAIQATTPTEGDPVHIADLNLILGQCATHCTTAAGFSNCATGFFTFV